jgi:hypothetical protein
MNSKRTVQVPVSELRDMVFLTQPKDLVMIYLMSRASTGHLPVYFAAVPLDIIRPFSSEYDPRRHPVGRQAVDDKKQEWLSGHFPTMWVYPDQSAYVMSDDYITFCAAQEGQPDFVPCFILGDFEDTRVKDRQGPIEIADVRKALGFAE